MRKALSPHLTFHMTLTRNGTISCLPKCARICLSIPTGRLLEDGSTPTGLTLVIPIEKRNAALKENHDEPTAGHLSRTETHQRLACYYYWPSIYKNVAEFVREFAVCQQCKVSQQAPAGLIMGKRTITRQWDMVAGDVMGPFPRFTHGYEYLLIFMDMFTHWIECIPIRKANAQTIRRELDERIFMRFGISEVFHCDNGTEFKNATIENSWRNADPDSRLSRCIGLAQIH